MSKPYYFKFKPEQISAIRSALDAKRKSVKLTLDHDQLIGGSTLVHISLNNVIKCRDAINRKKPVQLLFMSKAMKEVVSSTGASDMSGGCAQCTNGGCASSTCTASGGCAQCGKKKAGSLISSIQSLSKSSSNVRGSGIRIF